jgi:hypothetical protein
MTGLAPEYLRSKFVEYFFLFVLFYIVLCKSDKFTVGK